MKGGRCPLYFFQKVLKIIFLMFMIPYQEVGEKFTIFVSSENDFIKKFISFGPEIIENIFVKKS